MSSDSCVQVVLRIRPLSALERSQSAPVICQLASAPPHSVELSTSRRDREVLVFTYDAVQDDNERLQRSESGEGETEETCQRHLFDLVGQPLVDSALKGFNVSLLAYGQTSSGKTYCMQGGQGELRGIIPRVCEALFTGAQRHQNELLGSGDPFDELMFSVECSYIEIYAERIRDLLDPNPAKKPLKIRENPKTGPYVENVSLMAVSDVESALRLLHIGSQERTVAATCMNIESSRSHAVFSIVFTRTEVDATTKLISNTVSKINLVDLAGSERADRTGTSGVRLKEASNINKSLTTLGRVVQALAQRSEYITNRGALAASNPRSNGRTSVSASRGSVIRRDSDISGTLEGRSSRSSSITSSFVPFRDSVLTWLLKESLGGNSKTSILACCSPVQEYTEETLSTLRYASRAKNIINRAVVNEDPNAQVIRQLKAEIEALKQKLMQSGSITTPAPVSEPVFSCTDHEQVALEKRQKEEEVAYMAASIAALKAELTQNQASMTTLISEWADKLAKAQKAERESVAQLEARGINASTTVDSALPSLINLNSDPALQSMLVFQLKIGVTVLGSRSHDARSLQLRSIAGADDEDQCASDAIEMASVRHATATVPQVDDLAPATSTEHSITLSGLHVKLDHCRFRLTALGMTISIEPVLFDTSSSMPDTRINGELLSAPRVLQHNDRVVIGLQHFFRVSYPQAIITTPLRNGTNPKHSNSALVVPVKVSMIDFDFAQRELMSQRDDGHKQSPSRRMSRRQSMIQRALNSALLEEDIDSVQTKSDILVQPVSAPPYASPPHTPHSATSMHNTSLPLIPKLTKCMSDPYSGDDSLDLTTAVTAFHTRCESKSVISPMRTVSLPKTAPVTPTSSGMSTIIINQSSTDPNVDRNITFHLGQDVKSSSAWVAKRAVTKGELDELIARQRYLLSRQQQFALAKKDSNTLLLMQPLRSLSAAQYRAVSLACFNWRWHAIRGQLHDQVMRCVFLCDEANALCAALNYSERYKCVLKSSLNLLPESHLCLPSSSFITAPQSSPLQRFRRLYLIIPHIVQVWSKRLPIPSLSFDLHLFQDQLAGLRHQYHETVADTDGESTEVESLASSQSYNRTFSSLSASSLSLLPSYVLQQQPQLLGRALCFLSALRFGFAIKHNLPVLDEYGEHCGTLMVEAEIQSVDEIISRRDRQSQEDLSKVRGDDEDQSLRLDALDSRYSKTVSDADVACNDASEASIMTDLLSPRQLNNAPAEFAHSHRQLAIHVRLVHIEFSSRNLCRDGMQSIWIKYLLKDSENVRRSNRVTLNDFELRFPFDHSSTHYFTDAEMLHLSDWLLYDALVFEVWCKVNADEKQTSQFRTRGMSTQIPNQVLSQLGASSTTSFLRKRAQSALNGSGKGSLLVEDSISALSPAPRASVSRVALSPSQRLDVQDEYGTRLSINSRKSFESEKVCTSNIKAPAYLLFFVADIEEISIMAKSTSPPVFVSCPIKEPRGTEAPMLRCSIGRTRRLVISLLQTDNNPFVVESISSIRATALCLSRNGVIIKSLSAPISSATLGTTDDEWAFSLQKPIRNIEAKLHVYTATFPQSLAQHTWFNSVSQDGDRVHIRLRFHCVFNTTTSPVIFSTELVVKMYKDSDKLNNNGFFTPSKRERNNLLETERFARLGTGITVTRMPTPQTCLNVFREHELVLEQIQRRVRAVQESQNDHLLSKLEQTAPLYANALRASILSSSDAMSKKFTLRFSRIIADLATRAGIELSVEPLHKEFGIKSSTLLELKDGKLFAVWCVLRPPFLFTYSRRNDRKELQCISTFEATLTSVQHSLTFTLRHISGACITLQANNEQEWQSWLQAFSVYTRVQMHQTQI